MTKNKLVADATKPKFMTWEMPAWVMPFVDWTIKMLAGAFFIACTYGYVAGWLKEHQAQHDLSIVGGVIVVSVALYLFTRKK